MRNQRKIKGFTLLELLIVVVILAILAGLALPQYFRTVGRARQAEGWQMLGQLRGSMSRYYAESNDYSAVTIGDLDVDDPNNVATRLFDYTITAQGVTTFTLQADPITAVCGGCNTLTIDDAGARTETP